MWIVAEAFVSELLDGLAALVKDKVAMLLGVTGEIKRLQEKFRTMSTVFAHAENKRIQGKAIDDWLRKLKDAMYDADDILDECRIEAEKSKAPASSYFSVGMSAYKKVRFTSQIGTRIQDLNDRLKDIWEEKSKLNLQLSSANHRNVQNPVTSQVSRTSSPVPEPDIVGSNIEMDTEKLVELLMKEDSRENILTYAIVGIGGIGKTTLARKIFNDERINANFPMKLWVCVSKDFEENSLLKDIITQAGGKPEGASSRALLEPMVQKAVTNKKFLLVLDDSWDQKVWNDLLQNPLQSGATGSRVLVTTRNEGVAMQMKAVAPHHKVEVLSAEDGWALLCKKVVLSGQEGEIEDLKDIGGEIVDKCGRLPLAIKTIGGVLLSRKSRNKKDWERVLKTLSNNAWSSFTDFPKEVRPALFLSYEDLPSHLKQCFLYCSLFPEDYPINRGKLINYWISEGFIHEEGDLTLEELGEDYYADLVQRSIFQPDDEFHRSTVHDLLWSLARFLAHDENLVMNDGFEILNSSSSVNPRRLQVSHVSEENRQAFIDVLEGHNSLRTLLLRLDGSRVEENEVDNLIKKTPRLRVLDFLWCRIIKLPDSLGNLIHLRYLDLTYSEISELPESIGNLVNLQFLILQFCQNLRSLPKCIGKLHNLRCLDLFATGQLEGMPIEIANLHRLNTLTGFAVRNNNSEAGWCTLEELRSLQKLKKLGIENLDRALNEGDVRRVNALRDMSQLEELLLSCSCSTFGGAERACDFGEEEINRIEEIFEVTLRPPPRLESLRICYFFGFHYPSWIAIIASSSTDSLLSELRRLLLYCCNICPQLPPLGKLPNLDYLRIYHADAVKKIGTEFLGQEPDYCSRDQGGSRIQISFPKLTKLIFEWMGNWEEWEWEVKDDDRLIALPNLKELTFEWCPKLRSLPSGLVHHATTLTKLRIYFCGSLKAIRGFSSVKELEISYSRNLEGVSDLPSLKTLILTDLNMCSLPEWFHGGQTDFPALNKLEIVASIQLLRRCLKDGLDWPKIEHIPYVYASVHFGTGYISKSPTAFSTNIND